METVSEVLKRFNLSLDLTPELLSLEVKGGYNKYEIDEDDDEDEYINKSIAYIFTSDYQKDKDNTDDPNDEYIALLIISVSEDDCSVADLIQPAPGRPGMGYIYNSNGDCAIT
ncbi:hypothetical protein [Methanobrevibacter wolinii]|uniref:hypothetical protein n=1 Tax=Methanobrevibacter wolinii TaxID=190977 RepID=UPI000B2CD32D|nr:hypothetical protein [Methanobrevibacter wolinii]